MRGKLMGGQGQLSAGQFLCAAGEFRAERPVGELLEDSHVTAVQAASTRRQRLSQAGSQVSVKMLRCGSSSAAPSMIC